MPEQELKLHVPAQARRGVERQLQQRPVTRQRLHALYFDTSERELARARIALRLRREGRAWVQTLKMPGADAITRIELNHDRPGPVLDLTLYAGTDAEPALTALRGTLAARYETDVMRWTQRLRTRAGTVELAYDRGTLRAGELTLPVSELEFELVSGRPAAIFALARRWQQQHALVLDARSKSERGDALASAAQALAQACPPADAGIGAARAAEIARFWAPRNARAVRLDPAMTPAEALRAVGAECLDQVVRNAAVLAEVDTAGVYAAGHPEHVHQLRVGLRRLRSAWKLFDGWTELPGAALEQAVREHFSAFGATRDEDVLQDTIVPALVRAGMPALTLPASAGSMDARTLACAPAFQGWLLDMLAWTVGALPPAPAAPAPSPAGPADDSGPVRPTIISLTPETSEPPTLRALLTGRLRKWHRRVVAEGKQFASLDPTARHELRKRAKRLRYGLSFAESLLPPVRLRAYRKRLAQLQDVLGELNDLAVAQERYRELTAAYPQAWFAQGWIAARLNELAVGAQQAFEDLARCRPFWK